MKRIAILTLLFPILFCSCSRSTSKRFIMKIKEKTEEKYTQVFEPKREDIIGVWVSDDGAEFQFNSDSTFTVTNIPESIFLGNCKSTKLFSYYGTWDIYYKETTYTWKVDLTMSTKYYFPDGNGFWGAGIEIERKFWGSSKWGLYLIDFCEYEDKYEFKPATSK